MLRSQKQRRDEHRCVEIVPATGRPCNLLFARAWNLKRHQRHQHQDRGIVFKNYDPTATQRKTTNPPATETPMPRTPGSKTEIEHRLAPVIPAPSCPAPAIPLSAPSTPPTITMPKTPVPYASSVQTQTPAISESTSTPSEMDSSRFEAQPANDVTPNRSQSVADVEDPENPTSESDASMYWTPLQSGSGSPVEQGFQTDETGSDRLEPNAYREERMSRLSASCEDPSGGGRKRKRSTDKGRTVDARLKPAVPTYLVKRSKKTLGQQRGLEWLSASGKAHFDDTHEMLLAQWGVKAGHRGTCVLLPEDWKALDPIDLMTTFRISNLLPEDLAGRGTLIRIMRPLWLELPRGMDTGLGLALNWIIFLAVDPSSQWTALISVIMSTASYISPTSQLIPIWTAGTAALRPASCAKRAEKFLNIVGSIRPLA